MATWSTIFFQGYPCSLGYENQMSRLSRTPGTLSRTPRPYLDIFPYTSQ
uniref:Uncharacterized protein n=1 Tax=Anguilla anguilla TaxID=7936 RepID=A0A0E9XUS0_ANGAN